MPSVMFLLGVKLITVVLTEVFNKFRDNHSITYDHVLKMGKKKADGLGYPSTATPA